MFFRTIKFRLTLWYLAALAILLLFFGSLSYFLLSRNMYMNLDNSLRTRAQEISTSLNTQMMGEVTFTVQQQLGEMVLIYNTGNSLVLSSGPHLDPSISQLIIDDVLAGNNSITVASTTDGQRVHLYAEQISGPFSPVLIVGRSIVETYQTLAEFRRILFIGMSTMIVMAGIGGLFLAARALKPVNDIIRTAKSIEETDLSRRIDVQTNDELGRLAATLNEMIARLEKAFERQRQFTADASHELRTPLSVIEAETTLTLRRERSPEDYQKSLESINEEVAYMSSILEKLLMLARADAGKEQINYHDVNLKQLSAALAPDIEMLAREKGLQFVFTADTDLMITGDEIKLKQLLLNLLDNALKYTAQGSVSLSLSRSDNNAVITVTDTGIGIPEEHLAHIFERFYRVDKARSRSEHGTGLGLTIVKYITEAHNGKIKVVSQPGKGSTFIVTLPLSSG